MKRISILLIALMTTLSLFAGDPVEQAYYNDVYEYLDDPESVYNSITIEEAVTIFSQEGTYAFLLGGAWCPNTTAVIGYINEVAKEYGVNTIHNLDFRLDGTTADTHIRETETSSRKAAKYNYLYGGLVTDYLTNLDDFIEYKADTASAVTYTDLEGVRHTVGKVQVPFIFIYDKDNKDEDGNPAPIKGGLELMLYRQDFLNEDGTESEEKVEAYKDLLRKDVFDHLGNDGITPFTDGDYLRIAMHKNEEHYLNDKVPIFTEDEPINVDSLTYHQIKWLFEQEGNYLVLFGGTWCKNTRAAIKLINDYAVANDEIVYINDFKLDSAYPEYKFGSKTDFQIRRNENMPFTYLYVDLIKTYLPNLETEIPIENGIYYIDEDGSQVIANKIQVPYLFAYEKGAEDENGHDAPILAYIEEMYTLMPDWDSYIYLPDNYDSYISGIERVFKAHGVNLGNEPEPEPEPEPAASSTSLWSRFLKR